MAALDYAQELMAQKANRLNEYLEQTQELCRLLEDPAVNDLTNLEQIAACIDKRAALIAKIDEIDGLLARKAIVGEEESSGFKNHRRLCRHLIEQIAGLEEKNERALTQVMEELQAKMKKTSETMKGVAAYTPVDPTFYYRIDWKK